MTAWLIRWGLLLAGFLTGCWWAGRKVQAQQQIIDGLKAAEDHAHCQRVFAKLSDYIGWQEQRLAMWEAGPGQVVGEAEQILREEAGS
jgi:hypothetical protein